MARNDRRLITTKTANFAARPGSSTIRHPATALDVNMIEFLIAAELPFMIVCTKADKLSKNKCAQSIAALRRQLGFSRDEVEIIPISSADGSGIDDLKSGPRTPHQSLQQRRKQRGIDLRRTACRRTC